MNIDSILKLIGLIVVLKEPEKFRDLLNLASQTNVKETKHGYYDLKTGKEYNGEIYIHGNSSPFTDGCGNVIVWR